MHSKWTVLAAVIHILQSTASGQLSITSVDSAGTLVWSNCFAGLPFDNTNQPIYSVDWSSSATGAWQRAALVTNGYSFTVDEALRRAKSNLLVRVEWVNATSAPPYGTYEIVPVVPYLDELDGWVILTPESTNSITGSWHLQPTSWNPSANGYVFGGVYRSMVAVFLRGGPNYYALDGWYNGTGFTGQWYRCGFVCIPAGTYTARRICP